LDGVWNGTTSQNGAISFTIASNAIVALKGGPFSLQNCTVTSMTQNVDPAIPLTGNTFSAIRGSWPVSYAITGTLSLSAQPFSASGDLQLTDTGSNCGSSTISWNVWKQ
jgi:hypothetical protein